jgi:hypothetical protein
MNVEVDKAVAGMICQAIPSFTLHHAVPFDSRNEGLKRGVVGVICQPPPFSIPHYVIPFESRNEGIKHGG